MAQRTPEDDDKMFSQLVEGVVTKVQTKTKCESSDELRDVIRLHIHTWLYELEETNPLYKVSELIPVGSYAEGTKIIQPDEFDYLAVIEEFSKPNVIAIDVDNSNIKRGLVKVVVIDEELKSKCSGLFKDQHLECFQPINFPDPGEERFGHVLLETLKKTVKRSVNLRTLSYGTPTDIDCKILLNTVEDTPLYFIGARFRAPNVIIRFEYKGIDISVDVSPAIRYEHIQDCFQAKECAGPTFAELVLGRKSLLLIGTAFKSDFKVTVTEAEVEYIQTVMKPKHKTVYIFLKYVVLLFNELGGRPFPFSSYMMKSICIHHDAKCEKKGNLMKECFKSVVKDLNICKQQKFVESIVNKQIQLGPNFIEEWDGECLLPGIDKISQLILDITTVEKFETILKEIVRDEHKTRTDAQEEESRKRREAHERYQVELDAYISKFVDMGFDRKDVREVMKIYIGDDSLMIAALTDMVKQREEEKIEQKGSSSTTIHENPVHNSQTTSVSDNRVLDRTSNEAGSKQDQNSHSENDASTVNNSPNPVTYEILYQRNKDV